MQQTKEQEIESLKNQIDELREWNCNKLADVLAVDLQNLLREVN